MKTESPAPPASFKELLAAATPGPWNVYQATHYPDAIKRGWREIHAAGNSAPVAPDWFTRFSDGESEEHHGIKISEPDAAYIARLNPATMGLALERLDAMHKRLTAIPVDDLTMREEMCLDDIIVIFTALNSPTP